jgi:hypothetical protein
MENNEDDRYILGLISAEYGSSEGHTDSKRLQYQIKTWKVMVSLEVRAGYWGLTFYGKFMDAWAKYAMELKTSKFRLRKCSKIKKARQ